MSLLKIVSTLCLSLLAAVTVDAQIIDDGDPREIREFDVVVRMDGTQLEGTIEATTTAVIKLASKSGRAVIDIDRRDVSKVYRRNSADNAYRARKRGVADDDYAAQLQLGEWSLGAGLADKGLRHILHANKLDPSAEAPYLALLPIFAARGSGTWEARDEEMGVYLRAMRSNLENPEVPYRIATLLTDLGETAGAILMLEQLLKLPYIGKAPQVAAKAEDLLAMLYQAEGRRQEAEALVNRITGDREGASATRGLQMKARWLLDDVAAGRTEMTRELESIIEQLLQADSGSGAAYSMRSALHVLNGRFEEAAADTARAFSQGEVSYETRITAALASACAGQFKKAAELLNHISEQTPHQHSIEAYLWDNQGDPERALGALQALLDAESASWRTWIIALQLKQRLKPDQTLDREWEEFLERFRGIPAAFAEGALFKGEAALRNGSGAAARRWLGYVQQAQPETAELLLRVGQSQLLAGGDLTVARSALERALDENPKDEAILNSLGHLEYREGRLDKAVRWFDQVIAQYGSKEAELADPPEALAYALRAKRQARDAMTEEMWIDGFDRENSSNLLNNWQEEETYNISVELDKRKAVFEGTQGFQNDGLTVMWRTLPSPSRVTRVRARIAVGESSPVRAGLRLESAEGDRGVVFYRDLNGLLAIGLNNGEEFEAIVAPSESNSAAGSNGDEEGAGGGDEAGGDAAGSDETGSDEAGSDGGNSGRAKDPYDMRRLEWPDDGKEHLLEIRMSGDRGTDLEFYFDGERVARKVRPPFGARARGGLRAGVSGQAALDERYRIEVSEFAIFRKLPEGRERGRR